MGGIGLIAAAVIIVYIIAKYAYLTRKAQAEHGYTRKEASPTRYLEWGAIALGVGLGVVVAALLSNLHLSEDTMDLLILGTIIVFGGAGLLGAYYIQKGLGNR